MGPAAVSEWNQQVGECEGAEVPISAADGSSSSKSRGSTLGSSTVTGESPLQGEVDDLVAARMGLMGEMVRAQQRRAQRQQQQSGGKHDKVGG